MALISARRQHGRFGLRKILPIILPVILVGAGFLGGTLVAAESGAPSITSDKADYMPGEFVTLSGAGWQSGESVMVLVSASDGDQSWSYEASPTASDAGTFVLQFQLPDWFVALYSVNARGFSGATASTTFTDANFTFDGGVYPYQLTGGSIVFSVGGAGNNVPSHFMWNRKLPSGSYAYTGISFNGTSSGNKTLTVPATATGTYELNVADDGSTAPSTACGQNSCGRYGIWGPNQSSFNPGQGLTIAGGGARPGQAAGAANAVTVKLFDPNNIQVGSSLSLGTDANGEYTSGTIRTFAASDLAGTWRVEISSAARYDTNSNPAGFTSSTNITFVVPNQAPTVSANGASVSVNEGQAGNNAGTYSDPDSADNVSISASVGSISKTGTNSGTWSWSFAATDGPTDSQTVTISANDGHGHIVTTTFSLTVNNVAPTATFNAPASVDEGTAISLSLTGAFDPSSADTTAGLKYAFDCGDGSGYGALGGSSSTSCPTTDNGSRAVKGKIQDKDGGSSEYSATVTIKNLAPKVTITTPPAGSVYPVNTPVTFTGAFTDAGSTDTHTALWTFDLISALGIVTESGGNGTVSATYTFGSAGVYNVKLTVTDDDGDSGTATQVNGFDAMVVIYDPNAGFVTGGGWIISPPGAYYANPSATGKASFGFVSKYQNGAKPPTGETEFNYQSAGFNFHSSSYEWLVVSGAKAQYKGSGTVNGSGDYGFMLTATDGQLTGGGGTDRIRLKVWNKATGAIIYDNLLGASDDMDVTVPQALGGGSIVIHK